MHAIDLDAYFRRIGYQGPARPDFETLRALHQAHARTFVFENLNTWTGRPVPLGLAEIEEKFVGAGRGGYCFETNALFKAVLDQLGFHVTPLIGWVVWMQPPGSRPARTHMLLKVELDGRPWIADVGFGGIGQTVPLALDTAERQATPDEPRRYRTDAHGVVTHQVELAPDQWEDLYRFDLHESLPMDYEVANWFTSTHPESLFRKTLLVTSVHPDQRRTLAFGEFTRRFPDGTSEKRAIAGDEDLRGLLVREFGLPADDPAVRDARLTIAC